MFSIHATHSCDISPHAYRVTRNEIKNLHPNKHADSLEQSAHNHISIYTITPHSRLSSLDLGKAVQALFTLSSLGDWLYCVSVGGEDTQMGGRVDGLYSLLLLLLRSLNLSRTKIGCGTGGCMPNTKKMPSFFSPSACPIPTLDTKLLATKPSDFLASSERLRLHMTPM